MDKFKEEGIDEVKEVDYANSGTNSQSGPFLSLYQSAYYVCKKAWYEYPEKCQQIANLCVLSMYKMDKGVC